MKLLVSACLLGVGCRYDGKSNQLPQYKRLLKEHTCIPICPEQLGGLPTPRCPAEALRLCDLYHCKAALLKERSPSCGSGQIYDGTFTHTLTEGDGLTAQMLKKKGVEVYGESQLEELINDRPFFFSI